jgi:hypothetical protein
MPPLLLALVHATNAVLPNVEAGVARAAALLSTSVPRVTTQHHEAALYYAISATIDTGRDIFTPLTPRPAGNAVPMRMSVTPSAPHPRAHRRSFLTKR